MPADRRIEYRVEGPNWQGATLYTRTSAERERERLPPEGYRVQQRTITVGPWTDVEGDETDD
jgi:hypothetical protein